MPRTLSRFVFGRAPLRVYWELTRACDLACRHCRAEAIPVRHPDELNTAEGLRLLEQLSAFGDPTPHLVLTGGDPLKRPDLWVLIAAARAFGLAVSVAPSATALLDATALAHLQEGGGAARWSLFFLVSVGRGAVLESITPAAAEDLMRWLVELSAQGVGPVVTTTEGPHFRRVILQRHGAPVGGHGAGIRDGNGVMFISHMGDVQPSGFLPLTAGNVRRQHVVQIYREASLFRTLRRVDLFAGRCGRCEFQWQCGGSRARAFAASGDPFGEDPLCSYQPQRERSPAAASPSPGGLEGA